MKNLSLLALSLSMAWMSSATAVAQDHGDKKYWEHRKEADKKRDEYYRERDKKRDEYYKERNKKDKEYYKEQVKRQKEYDKDHGDWDDDDERELPRWAVAHRYRADRHVYFRDYRTFYDPYRRGYVYRQNNNWRFSRTVPAFLANINLDRARVQVMADVPLSRHPEYYYESYSRKYPRNPNIQVSLNIF